MSFFRIIAASASSINAQNASHRAVTPMPQERGVDGFLHVRIGRYGVLLPEGSLLFLAASAITSEVGRNALRILFSTLPGAA